MEFGIDATMITDADIRIAGNQGVEFNNDATVGAASSDGSAEHGHIAIESASGDVVFADGAIVYGDRSFKANAGGNIVLTGDSDLNSDLLVELVAKGDILMRDSIRLGDNDSGQLTEKVVLEAGGNIVQSDIGADMGIVAQNLTATAGGDVSIGSTGIDGDTGNSFNAADIAAGGDVTIGVRDVGQTSIDINREKQGEVAGNVSIVAIDTDVKLGGIDVVGDVNIVAEGVTSDKIHAQGGVQIATSGYDHDATDGVRITSLTGSEVTVVTGEGEVAIGKLVTTEGNANIYRKETTVAGKVDLGQDSQVAGALTVINGQGAVSGNITTQGPIYAFADRPGSVNASGFVSGEGKVAVFGHADRVVKYLPDVTAGHGGEISHFVPLDFSMPVFGAIDAVKNRSLIRPDLLQQSLDRMHSGTLVIEHSVTDSWTLEMLKSGWFSAKAEVRGMD